MPFAPTDIAGLRCFEADSLSLSAGDPVATWTDAGSAGVTLTAAGGARPTYRASVAALNSKPALEFNGTANTLLASESPSWGDFTLVAVFVPTNGGAAFERLVDKQYDTGTWLGRAGDASDTWGGGVREAGSPFGRFVAAADDSAHVIVSRRSGTAHRVQVNGWETRTQGTPGNTATDTSAIRVGSSNGADWFDGYLAAVFWAPSALSDRNIDDLTNYLAAKYGAAANRTLAGGLELLATFDGATEEHRQLLGTAGGTTFFDAPYSYSPTSGFCRDPFGWRDGDNYRFSHTDGTFGTLKQWAIASGDGFDYATLKTVDWDGVVSGITQAWAPKRFVDSGGEFFFVSVSTDSATSFQLYETHPATPGDYDTLTAPVQITVTSRSNVIDGFVLPPGRGVFDASKWELWFKNEATGQKVIEVATATSRTGTYTVIKSGDWAGWGDEVEGAYVYPITGGHRVIVDPYAAGTGLQYSDSTDGGATWSALAGLSAPAPVLRHGSLMRAAAAGGGARRRRVLLTGAR